MPQAKNDGPDMRTTDGADRISTKLLREYLIWALSHDAVPDQADDLIFDYVVGGRLHPTVAAASLRKLVGEMIGAATDEDWLAVFDTLVSEAREALSELGSMTARDPSPSRVQQLKGPLRAARRWWTGRT